MNIKNRFVKTFSSDFLKLWLHWLSSIEDKI